jgi:hypothetical protein
MAKKLKHKFAKAKGSIKKHIAHPKDIIGNAKQPAMQIALATAGTIGAQKFLDFQTLMKDKYAKEPDSFIFKHEGAIKVGGAIIAIAAWKTMPEWLKWLVIGIGVQGAIKAVRQYTKDDKGETKVPQIGAAEMDEAINSLAAEIKSVAEKERTSVGNISDIGASELQFNSATGVGGVMGMGMDESY